MFLFEEKLNQAGIADTRTPYLSKALEMLHYGIAMCDPVNRRVFAEMHPYAVRAAVEFAKIEELDQDLWGVIEMPDWVSNYDEYQTECALDLEAES
jgi:hypothetical protein